MKIFSPCLIAASTLMLLSCSKEQQLDSARADMQHNISERAALDARYPASHDAERERLQNQMRDIINRMRDLNAQK
jgi:hypothetical protein